MDFKMMEVAEEFLFTWRIENFSMCSKAEDEYLESAVVVVDSEKKRKLKLWFYPRGWRNSKYLSCYVNLLQVENWKNARIGYSFTIAGTKDISIFKQTPEFMIITYHATDVQLAEREEILKDKNVYLPNDALTVQFRMRIAGDEAVSTELVDLHLGNEDVLPGEILSSAARHELEEFRTHFSSNQCSAVTRIRERRKSLVWPIKGIRALRPNHRLSVPIVSAIADDPSFVLTFFLTGESAEDLITNIEIRRRDSDNSKHLFVKCKITVPGSKKDVKLHSEGEHFFQALREEVALNLSLSIHDEDVEIYLDNAVWNFPFSIPKQELQNHFINDVLYLHCEFVYSREGDEYQTENTDLVPFHYAIRPDLKSSNISEELKDAYETGMFSDVTLRVGNRLFKTHKIILSTRSPVFRAMFENDMKEKESGFVDISDLDPDTLDRMLLFLYSDQLDVLPIIDAAKLYTSADKYQILSLRQRCSLFLQSILSVSNVCLVLNLADLHQDDHLMDAAIEFVYRNSNEIFVSDEWKSLMESNIKLSASVMLQKLTRKTN